jgi:hypothetical protein
MTVFQKYTVSINVSRFSSNGFWLGNGIEHVVKGTSLGADCTTNIYTPSKDGVTGKFNFENNTWEEIENNSQIEFFDENGGRYKLGVPGKDFPEWAIHETPPSYDPEKETVLFKNGCWKVFDIQIGKPFWDKYGVQQLVAEFNFTLSDECTFESPPDVQEGYAVFLVEGKWRSFEDHRGKIAYKKDRSGAFEIEELGKLPDDVTLIEPSKPEPTAEELAVKAMAQREAAYRTESDPLFLEAIRKDAAGDAEGATAAREAGLVAVASIHARFPINVSA